MADWLSGSDFGEEEDAMFAGRPSAFGGKAGPSAVNTYKQLAGWALGKVIGKNTSQYADTEEGLSACAEVSEEVGVRAGLLTKKSGSQKGQGRQGPNEPVPAHVFLGTELTLERRKEGRNRRDKTELEDAGKAGEGAKKPRMHLRDFDPLERGEAGVAPLLRGDFFRLVNVANYENGTLPKYCSTGGFSTSWSVSFESSWKRLIDKAREMHTEGSVVDFVWRRAADPHGLEGAERGSEVGPEVVCLSQPVDFEQVGEQAHAAESWRMVVGKSTSGTSFRSAKSQPRNDTWPTWRTNAVANLFLCPLLHDGRLVLNIVRHGVAGFASHPSGHVPVHLELAVRQVVRRQLAAGMPMRVVSCNLLNHYKASGEPEMTERQLFTFQEVMRRINAKHLAADTQPDALPKDLPVVQYAQLLLPGNTDQWEMGADYNRKKNVDCFLLYLQWITDDAVHAIKRLLVDPDVTQHGPGGVHAASVEAEATPHWGRLERAETLCLQQALLSEGTADKAAVVDSVTWGDTPVDAYFKSILLLPLVRASDQEVWETLVRVLPEYLQKRVELHNKAWRSNLDLTSDARPDMTRETVALVRHLLHMLSSLLGLVYRRLVRSSPRRIAVAHSAAATAQPPTQPELEAAPPSPTLLGVAGSESEEAEAGGAQGEEASEAAAAPEGEACSSAGDEEGRAAKREGEVDEESVMKAITVHAKELERVRMSVNLLRTLVQAELGGWEGGYSDSTEARAEEGEAARRRFSRATSMSVAALLNQTLGVMAFINCKSGLDRTGLQTAMQSCVSALWTLYPEQRWSLHLAMINSHLFQARSSSGEEAFVQPASMESFQSEQERQVWFKSLFRERSLVRAHRLHEPSLREAPPDREAPGAAGRREGSNVPFCDDLLVFDDNSRMLRALHPFRCLQRNFMLGYLTEANAVITYASTGVRGMKYEGHPLIGALIPRDIRVSQVHRHAPKGTGDSIRMMQLTARQYLGLKSLAGGKLAQDTLTDLGRLLLIDAAKYRCS